MNDDPSGRDQDQHGGQPPDGQSYDRQKFSPATFRPPIASEEAEAPERSAAPTTNDDFLRAVFAECPDGAVSLVCSKAGDPATGGWSPRTAFEQECPTDHNNYFNCSSFRQVEGSPTAKKEAFAAYHVVVLDDVGTKVDRSKLEAIEPTWRLETSPGNEQVGLVIEPPVTDLAQLEDLQDRVVAAGLCDPGAKGASRWMRLPVGINGKKKYEVDGRPYCCRLTEWRPERRCSVDELISLLGLPELPAKLPRSAVAPRHYRDDDVCTFPGAENPVVSALKQQQLYKRQISPGQHDITCPWVAEHTDELDTGACYWEPDEDYPTGGFKCQHSHGDRLHVGDLLKVLEVEPTAATNKPVIRLVGGAFDRVIRAAEQALAHTNRIYQYGGAIVALHEDRASGELRIEPFSDQRLKRELTKVAVWQQPTVSGMRVVDPPPSYVTGLFRAQQYEALPKLRGLARQPYLTSDGELVLTPGYNSKTGIYGSFEAGQFESLDVSREGAEGALAEIDALLDEFHFATEHDRSAALCGILTAAARPSLPLAPAFNITASCPGSGKSYLADLFTAFATAGQASKASYPSTAEEATKAVLSHLISGPAVLNFDDMTKDWVAYGPVNRMLTSETIADRLLMTNRVQEASTRTLVIGTGNNIEPLADLRRRVLSIRIKPMTENPALLSYAGRPVERVRANRDHYVALALQIIQACRKAGAGRSAKFAVASFDVWSDLCREPLLWLGKADPATALRNQLLDDPDAQTLKEFTQAWYELRREQPTKVRDLIAFTTDFNSERLRDVLQELPVWDGGRINPSKLGWYIKRKSGRITGNLMIEPAECSERNAWRVLRVEAAPPLPPLKGAKGEPPSEVPPS